MMGKAIAALLILIGSTAAQAAKDDVVLFARPAEVYARAEDRSRARLLSVPCTERDIGRGCYRYDNRLWREGPCQYHIDARTIGSLATEECYKMEPARRYRGLWLDGFEAQHFYPDATALPKGHVIDPKAPDARERWDELRLATIWLDIGRSGLKHDFSKPGRLVLIEFIGRKTAYPGFYGHLGMSGHEIIVDKLISAAPIE